MADDLLPGHPQEPRDRLDPEVLGEEEVAAVVQRNQGDEPDEEHGPPDDVASQRRVDGSRRRRRHLAAAFSVASRGTMGLTSKVVVVVVGVE